MRSRTAEAELLVLERAGTSPIAKRGKPGRPAAAEYLSNVHRVWERRGYQRFYYHVSSITVDHWWDHQDVLNNIQMDLEQLYGGIVELVAVREWKGAGIKGRGLIFNFFFKIGPIPA